ncbi:MAG: class I SAM-dependent methyltransferase [bacterium]
MEFKFFNFQPEYTAELNLNHSAWLGHYSFGYDLVVNMKPRILVELGTYYGNSFFSFAQAVKDKNLVTKLIAVDTWQGDKHAQFYGEEVLKRVQLIKKKYFSQQKIELLKMTFDQALNSVENNSVDILHIDGLHTYDAVKHDFESWYPKISKNGIILLHDICEKKDDFGVYKLWDELKARYHTIQFNHSSGLGIVFMGEVKQFNMPSKKFLQAHYEVMAQMVLQTYDQIKLTNDLSQENSMLKNRSQHLEGVIQDQNVALRTLERIRNNRFYKILNGIRHFFLH